MRPCEHTRDDLLLDVLGELPPERLQALQDHLARCPACQHQHEVMTRTDGLLGHLIRTPEPPPPPRHRSWVEAQRASRSPDLPASRSHETEGGGLAPLGPPRRVWPPAVMAVCVLGLMLLGAWLWLGPSAEVKDPAKLTSALPSPPHIERSPHNAAEVDGGYGDAGQSVGAGPATQSNGDERAEQEVQPPKIAGPPPVDVVFVMGPGFFIQSKDRDKIPRMIQALFDELESYPGEARAAILPTSQQEAQALGLQTDQRAFFPPLVEKPAPLEGGASRLGLSSEWGALKQRLKSWRRSTRSVDTWPSHQAVAQVAGLIKNNPDSSRQTWLIYVGTPYDNRPQKPNLGGEDLDWSAFRKASLERQQESLQLLNELPHAKIISTRIWGNIFASKGWDKHCDVYPGHCLQVTYSKKPGANVVAWFRQDVLNLEPAPR